MRRTLRPPAALAMVALLSAGCSNAAAETGTGSNGGNKNAANQSGTAPPCTPVLLSDPRVSAVPVRENGEPLAELDELFGPTRARVRVSLAGRLVVARENLPPGVGLRVVDGYRTAAAQRAIISSYTARLRECHPTIGAAELERLTSRFVAPLAVAPHVSGAAVDVTLVDSAGRDLDLGTPIDATPEQSKGACYFDAPQVSGQARANRQLLARVLSDAGLVNYSTEWWHWSYGDRYWALMTGAPAALYGPVGRQSGRR
ncbi:MAG: M15 family metallopeptidase [Chloroflexota bacterium]